MKTRQCLLPFDLGPRVPREASHASPVVVGGRHAVKIEKDARHGTRARLRYVGRGHRGAPNRAQLAADQARNIRFAADEAEKAYDAFELACSPGVESLPPFQRESYLHATLGPLGLAQRLLEEVEDFVKRRIKRR